MSSHPPSPTPNPSPVPSQETFERVFSLQRRVEPDRENHITSRFSVLDMNTLALGGNSSDRNLDIYTSRRFKKLLGKNITAQPNSVYKGNMTCFSSGSNLDHNFALSPITATPQENRHYPLAGDSIAILSDSRVKNQLPGNSSNNPSTSKSPSSIYSHSLLQPIYVPVIRGPENRCAYYHHQQENRHP